MTAYAPLPRNTRKLEDGFARRGFQCTHGAHESDIASVYSTASENPSGRYRPFPDSRRSQKRTVGKGSLARDRANKNPAMKAGSAGNVIT
jgi:hypothetical protein